MESVRMSKDYKIKIDNVELTISIEEFLNRADSAEPVLKNLHYHAIYELFFLDEAPLTIHTSSGVSSYQNCLVCIPPFFKHNTFRSSGHRILFSFSQPTKRKSEFYDFLSSFFSNENPFSFPSSMEINFYINELMKLFYADNSIKDEIAVSFLKIIFYSIFIQNTVHKSSTHSISESYIVKIDNILSQFREEINLKKVASALNLSTKHSSRIIKNRYKKNLSELVTEKRLSVASELLLNSNKPISEIVEYVNFSSESYFYAQFKKAYGLTPLKYKKMYHDNIKNQK